MANISEACPCGSGVLLCDCCGPIISGKQPAKTAESLMRSRYSAYVLGEVDYLKKSWHPDTRPENLELAQNAVSWTGLSIIRSQAGLDGDHKGMVEFEARYEQDGQPGEIHETSRFVFEQGQWLYVDGDYKAGLKVGRNEPCPCGSGKKYKKCCGLG